MVPNLCGDGNENDIRMTIDDEIPLEQGDDGNAMGDEEQLLSPEEQNIPPVGTDAAVNVGPTGRRRRPPVWMGDYIH